MNSLLENPLIVCGFPKSGNTWIGYMLSYYFNAHYYDANVEEQRLSGVEHTPEDDEKFMYNADGFLGKLERPGQVREFSGIIKAHLHPRRFAGKHGRFFASVAPATHPPILIVREPKDVAVSYFFFTYFHMRLYHGSILNRLPGSWRVFLKKALYFEKFVLDVAREWREFHEEWQGTPYLLVRYEDLKADTYGTMGKLLAELGLPVQEEYLRQAIDYCRFDNLKKIETNYVRPQSKHDSFFREGKSGGWVKHFSKSLTQKFDANLGPVYPALGYGPTSS